MQSIVYTKDELHHRLHKVSTDLQEWHYNITQQLTADTSMLLFSLCQNSCKYVNKFKNTLYVGL